MPHGSGPAFEARVAALWKAIVDDDPAQAMPFFFPLGAYKQVKDVANPTADWTHRLVAAFGRDIHALHAEVARACRGGASGAGPSGAGGTGMGEGEACRLTGLEIPAGRARWVEPGEEYNKIGYYRVFGSRLGYEVPGADSSRGAAHLQRYIEVKSLISWRGEWYVVHLRAIK